MPFSRGCDIVSAESILSDLPVAASLTTPGNLIRRGLTCEVVRAEWRAPGYPLSADFFCVGCGRGSFHYAKDGLGLRRLTACADCAKLATVPPMSEPPGPRFPLRPAPAKVELLTNPPDEAGVDRAFRAGLPAPKGGFFVLRSVRGFAYCNFVIVVVWSKQKVYFLPCLRQPR